MKYKELIINAAKIAVSNKFFWFFGLFAAFLANGQFYQFSSSESSGAITAWKKIISTGIFNPDTFHNFLNLAQVNPIAFLSRLALLAAVVVMGILVLWLAVVSQGALIHGAAKLYSGKKIAFKDCLAGGRRHWWLIFFLQLLSKIILFLLLALTLLPGLQALLYAASQWKRSLYILLFLFIVLAAALFALIIRYSLSYGVIYSQRFIDALKSGFKLLRDNFLSSIEAGAIMFILNFLLSLALIVLFSALAIPFVLAVVIFYKLSLSWLITAALIIAVAVLAAAAMLTGGMLAAFNEIFWTYIFMALSRGQLSSWLGGIFKGVKN